MIRILSPLLVALALATAAAPASVVAAEAMARLHDREGNSVGTVALTELPYGTLLHARLAFMPPGAHAFHVHAVGTCEPPFKSAGGHFNPDGQDHGLADADGRHVGDMPNIHVPSNGTLEIEVLNSELRMDDRLFDADGASIVIHKGPDDYRSNPAGAAGPRIACGVIER